MDAVARKKRSMSVCEELRHSEKTFLWCMSISRLYSSYGKEVLDSEDLTIFDSLELLLETHGRLYEQLGCIPEESLVPDAINVFKAWIQTTNLLELYNYVARSYGQAQAIMPKIKQNNPQWKKFLEDLDYSATMQGLNLECLIKTQLCRIPRYLLLFSDLQRTIEPSSPMQKDLTIILNGLKVVQDFYLKAKRVTDRIEAALQLAPKLVAYKGVWPTTRELYMHIRLDLQNTQTATAYLFPDVFLMCQKERTPEPRHTVLLQLMYQDGLLEVFHEPTRKHPLHPSKWITPVAICRTSGCTSEQVGRFDLSDPSDHLHAKFLHTLAKFCYSSYNWKNSAAAVLLCNHPHAGANSTLRLQLSSLCIEEIAHALYEMRALKEPICKAHFL